MKLTGELKKKGTEAADKAEANGLDRQADVTLTDEELEKVAGGGIDDYDICMLNPDGSGFHEWEQLEREDGSFSSYNKVAWIPKRKSERSH